MKNSISLLSVALLSVSSTAFTGCKSKTSDSAASASSAATPAAHKAFEAGPSTPPPGFDLTLSVPATTKEFELVGTVVIYLADVEPLAAARTAFAQRDPDLATQTEKLPDGEVWRNEARAEVHRTLGEATLVCEAREVASIAETIATCKAITRVGKQLQIPLALKDVPQSILIDEVSFEVIRADAKDSATLEVETAGLDGLKILAQPPVPHGFAVAYQAYNGNTASKGFMSRAVARQRIGNNDVLCIGWPATAKDAISIVEHCAALH